VAVAAAGTELSPIFFLPTLGFLLPNSQHYTKLNYSRQKEKNSPSYFTKAQNGRERKFLLNSYFNSTATKKNYFYSSGSISHVRWRKRQQSSTVS
jgi:hypothetical protein